jgi:uncharacterized repeat protein (TIGR03803 family)
MEQTKKFCRPAAIVATLFFLSVMAQAQTLTVLHAFTGDSDGANPGGTGVTIDRAGNLYGGAGFGGLSGPQCYSAGTCGTIFKLARHGSSWIFDTLYSFHGSDGATPDAPLVIGPDGALYGSTFYGGTGCSNGCGNVFRLQPQPTFCASAQCSWTQTVLHQFSGQPDGGQPAFGAMSFDAAGNLFGTATQEGNDNCGTVFELARNGTQWTFNLLWTFTGYLDGCSSWSGVIFDQAGNLYGTTSEGGAHNDAGTAFELKPSGQSWSMYPLYQFDLSSTGEQSFGNLMFDHSGNLLGTNRFGGPGNTGGVFELSPSNGSWNLSLVHSFDLGEEEDGSQAPLLMDSSGNLYGTTVEGGRYSGGMVFKMTPSGSGYIFTDLYDFTGGSDGEWPSGQIVMDATGNIFGITELGGIKGGDICGTYGCGVVWELTP